MSDLDHNAAVVRLYVATYFRTAEGEPADDRTRARVLDAVQALLDAAVRP